MEQRLGKELLLKGDGKLAMEEYQVQAQREDACGCFLPVHKGELLQVQIEAVCEHQKSDGLARIDGYVLRVEHAAHLTGTGKTVLVEVLHVLRSHGVARLLEDRDTTNDSSAGEVEG